MPMTRALATVAHRNDERSWTDFLMLLQTVLCPPPRGGRKHRRAAAAYTIDTLQRLMGNAWVCGTPGVSLLAPTENHCHQKSGETWPPVWAERGLTRRHALPLFSEGLCPFNAETAIGASKPCTLRLCRLWVPPITRPPFAPEVVARCLRAFPAETVPGPTGLRVQHLRDACVAGGTDAFLTQLAAVVSLVSQGMAPATIAPVLAGAGLVALPKPSGGVRPIAIGELLRRLAGKCLMTMVREEARQYFWPSQVGVGVKGGAEEAVHTVRAWMQRNSSSNVTLPMLSTV